MNQPLISVIIPMYNAERFVAEALDNVLSQGIDALEIICVDDGSTDQSATIVQSYGSKVRYYQQENRGPAAARNVAFSYVRGQFVTFLDCDDLFPANKLKRQLALFDKDPSLDMVLGKSQYVFLDGSNPERFQFPNQTQTVWHILLGAGLFRTDVFRRIGLFNEELKIGDDMDWYNRAKEQGVSMRVMDDITLYYRHHDNNYTRNHDLVKKALLKTLKYSLDRRRSEAGVRTLPQFADFRQSTNSDAQ